MTAKQFNIAMLLIMFAVGVVVGVGVYHSNRARQLGCRAQAKLFGLEARDIGYCQFKIPLGLWVNADEWILVKALQNTENLEAR